MGKSINNKELGKGISQRKDGLYQGRFVNRFGKKQTVYARTLNEVRQKLRDKQYEDEKCLNVVTKAIDLDLLIKNCARQVNIAISKEEKKERRVLTRSETELFLNYAKDTFYYDMYVLALDTGMRIGELMGLKWSDIDFDRKMLYVRRSLCYFHKEGKYVVHWHDTKTHNSKRTIPLTSRALEAV